MALDVLDVSDLADFSGRAEASFVTPAQAETSLSQATLLFKIATCLKDWPTAEDDLQLARFGILSMSDAIFLALKYARTLAKPFQSETIGSYSYSRAANAVANRLPTGVTWFDMAVDILGICQDGDAILSSSISVFENEGISSLSDGRRARLGPKDFVYVGWPFSVGPPDNTAYFREGGGIIPWWVTVS